jgi:hypothetical protein
LPPPPGRGLDRRLTVAGIGVAALYLVALAGPGDVGGAGSGAASAWAAVGLVGQLGWLASAAASTALLGSAVLTVLGRR